MNHSGTLLASIYAFSKTSFAFCSLICSVVRAFTATERDSALDTELSGLKRSPSFGNDTKSKYRAFCIASYAQYSWLMSAKLTG